MGKPMFTIPVGTSLLAIRAYKNLSGYSSWKQMYDKHKQYGIAKTVKHNWDKNTYSTNFFNKPVTRGADVAAPVVYHKKVRRKVRKRLGSVKDPFDIVRVTP